MSSFLYDAFRKSKSYFLFYGLKPPKKINVEKVIVDKYPKLTEKYLKFFGDLSVSDINFLKKYIKYLVKEHKDINNQTMVQDHKKIKRCDVEDVKYMSYFYNLSEFVNQHIKFLNEFTYTDDFVKGLNQLYTAGWFWDKFAEFYKREHSVVFYISNKSFLRKYKESLK